MSTTPPPPLPAEDVLTVDVDKATVRDAKLGTAMEARELALGFGSATVLSDINVDIVKGQITALIGPTGSGKTTFLRSLNRMNDKVSKHWHKGEVLLDGSSIYAPGVQLMTLRRRVGMMFQRPNPFPMSIAENVLAGVKAHRIASKPLYRQSHRISAAPGTYHVQGQVPTTYREGAEALGMSPPYAMRRITLKAALPGITTGWLVALAIAIGETAPLLYTAGFSNSMPSLALTHSPISYLTYAVWAFYNYPSNTFVHLSYDAALILVVLVLLLIITARLIVSFTQRYTEKN